MRQKGGTIATTTLNPVRLGMTDLQVSAIAFGSRQLGGEWGQFDEDDAIAAIRHARELGVNLFDTSPAWLRSGVDASLEALGIEHIDVYQVHWPEPKGPGLPSQPEGGPRAEALRRGCARSLGEPACDRLDARHSDGAGHDRRRPSPDHIADSVAAGDDARMSAARPTIGFVGLGHMGGNMPPGTSMPATQSTAKREASTAQTNFLATVSSGTTPRGTSPSPSRSCSRRFPTTTC